MVSTGLLRVFALAGALFMVTVSAARADWQGLGPIAGGIEGAPTCFAAPPNVGYTHVDCYVKGGDGALWRRSSPDGADWSGAWESLGGSLLFDMPACVPSLAYSVDRIDCFVVFRGSRTLNQRTSTNGGQTWGAWIDRGGIIVGRPSCVMWLSQQTNCYAWFSDGTIQMGSLAASGWRPWVALASGFGGEPHCVSWTTSNSNNIDCFAPLASGGWVRNTAHASPTLQAPPIWLPVPVPSGGLPVAFDCRGPIYRSSVECFAYTHAPAFQGTLSNNYILTRLGVSPFGWTTFPNVTAPSMDSMPADQTFRPSCATTASGVSCFTVVRSVDPTTTGQEQLWMTPLAGGASVNLGGDLTSSPACVTLSDNATIECFARGTDGQIWVHRPDRMRLRPQSLCRFHRC